MQEDRFTEAEYSAFMRDSKILEMLEGVTALLASIECRLAHVEREVELLRREAQ